MDWLCTIINQSEIENDTTQARLGHGTTNGSSSSGRTDYNNDADVITILSEPRPEDGFVFILTKIITPSLCVFGLVGNFLNFLILVKRVSCQVIFSLFPACNHNHSTLCFGFGMVLRWVAKVFHMKYL